jgi:hypothetical protein
VLDTSVPVPVKDLFAVSPEFWKQFRDITMVKRVTNPASNSMQVNELLGIDRSAVNRDFGDQVHHNEDSLIVAHHSLPLCAIEARIEGFGRSLRGILDSGSKIIAMPKRIWEELGLPIRSDHTMKMSSANASINTTIGILKNLVLDFGAGEVMLQVQVLARANFDLLFRRPFHCLMRENTEDFPDGSQTITLHDPNTGSSFHCRRVRGLKGALIAARTRTVTATNL